MAPDPQQAGPKLAWSPEVRSWVSLLLFMHLFAVLVAVTSYSRPSGLQEKLHTLFAPYLRNLHLTAALPASYPFARFYLTHNLSTDVDFSCDVEISNKDGSVEKVSIPASGLWPLVRFRRYQALANAAGTLSEGEANEELASILPRAIAGSILQARGALEGTVRCRAHYLPEIESLAGNESTRRAALENYRDIYQAQVFVTSSGVELLKKSTTLEVAPVETAPKPPSTPQQRPSTSQP